MKIKSQTKEQIDFIFSHPLSFSSLATISLNFRGIIPPDFDVLNVSIDRGGKAVPHNVTLSLTMDNKRVLGVRVWDSKDKIFKEDHREYDKDKEVVKIFPRGEYQRINPAYKNTHYS